MILTSLLVWLSLQSFAGENSGALTREALLKGCEIPDRREFPVNPEVNPCENFYEYACSKVVSSYKLRDDRSFHVFSFSDSNERILFAKKKFLKLLSENPKLPLSKRGEPLRNVYAACMNEGASVKEEKSLVQNEVKVIDAIKDREALQKLLSDRVDQTERSFVSLETITDQDDPDTRDALFDMDLMTLPERSYYEKPEIVADTKAVMTEFFREIGKDDPEARAQSVIDFEKSFAQKYPLPAEFRERFTSRNFTSREELLKNYPALKLEHALGRVPKKTRIRNVIPEAFEYVNHALATAPLEQLKNVLLFQSVTRYMDDAYPKFFKLRFEFNKNHLGGPEVRPVRDERCTMMVMGSFGRELDNETLPILFPDFPTQKVVHLAETIRSSLLKGLEDNQWLSKEGKSGAIRKMKVAKLLLVKPETDQDWDFNPEAKYSPTQRYDNAKILGKNLIEKMIREYSEPVNHARWLMGPLTVNAYYSHSDNVFVLPMGILQYPFYDSSLPEESNLGAIGSVVGHELGHGIDDQGSKYDEKGRLKAWLGEKDRKEFAKRGDQFIARFEKLGHNGKLTLGENIGDHVGITTAYRAAFGETKPKAEDQKKFFLQYARSWCQVMRPKYLEMHLKTNPHAAGFARVNEQVRHVDGFQEGFSCKAGDGMFLPKSDRIHVW